MFARAKRIKKPRISEADIALLLMVNLLGGLSWSQASRFLTEWLTHLRLTRQPDCDHHPYGVTQFI